MPRGRILVADDNRDILRLVDVNLKFEEFDTLLASDGEEALELARTERPDVILLDIMLPRMDGWQVLKALKADPQTRDIPVVLMTGASLRDREDHELVQAVADYLSKPFNPLRLIEVVGNLLDRRGPLVEPPVSVDKRGTRVVFIDNGDSARVLRNFLGNPTIEIAAVIGPAQAEAVQLASELNIAVLSSYRSFRPARPVQLYIDTRVGTDEELLAYAAGEGAEVLYGASLRFMEDLLAARDTSHFKERDLVRELNERLQEYSILNDMSRLVSATPFNVSEIHEKTLQLALRLPTLATGCVLRYDESREKFVVAARVGLSRRFEERAQLPLSEPLVDELLTLRRPTVIADVRERYRSTLMGAAAQEGLASMICLPVVVQDRMVGMMMIGSHQPHQFRSQETLLLSTLAGQMGMALENAQLTEASRNKQAIIEQLLGKVILAQEDERKRLAAEIHDSVAQSLAGMLTQIQIAQTLLAAGDVEQTNVQLASLRKIIGDSVKEVRQIIFNLRPSSLDDLGLIPSIENYVKRYEREHGLTVEFVLGSMRKRLPPTLETTLFRIVQESLTNIKKHARADKAWIRLHADSHSVSLKVTDNGCGVQWHNMTEKFMRGDSHGVEGMKERTALLGGSFRIDSQPGQGTSVVVEIPIPRGGGEGAPVEGNLVVERTTASRELSAVGQTLATLSEQARDATPPRRTKGGKTRRSRT